MRCLSFKISRKKKSFLSYIVITFFAFTIFLLGGCGKQEQKPPSYPSVNVAFVKEGNTDLTINTTGIIAPYKEAKLAFKIPGKIHSGPLEEGAIVGLGDIVASLDKEDYLLQADTARYETEALNAELAKSKKDLIRYEQLFEQGAVSQILIDEMRFRNLAGIARSGQAASNSRQADLMVEYTDLKVPFSGIILKKYAEAGEIINVGSPIVSVGQLDKVKIFVTVPYSQIEVWKSGAQVTVLTDLIGNEFKNSDKKYLAKIIKINPVSNDRTGVFEAELLAHNTDLLLRPGQAVSISYTVKSKNCLWIPLKAVLSRGEELKYVFILNQNNTVTQRRVKLGSIIGDNVEVMSGVQNGEQILVAMPENLRDGERVEVKADGFN